MPRIFFLVVALCAVLFGPLTAPAYADDHACHAGPDRPACTILRPIHDERETPAGSPECVVIVGGLGSPTDNTDDAFFRVLLGEMAEDPAFRTIRFGFDLGTYDTTGSISRSANELARALGIALSECAAVHVLAHSMGGVVADRALAKSPPVSTYIALASPHNGANAARLVRSVVELDPLVAAAAKTAADTFGFHDPTAAAVRDLAARPAAPRPVRADAAVRLRVVTDPIVLRRDNIDRRLDVREYMPTPDGLDGHDAIARHPLVQDVVRNTLTTHRKAHETRSDDELGRALAASIALDAAIGDAEDRISGVLDSTRQLLFPYR